MNIGIVFYFLGWVLGIEGILMILPCVVALVYREPSGFYFLGVALFCGISGWLLAHRKLKSTVFYAKEGFVAVSLSWIVLSFFGALPFFLSGEIPLLEDALFEVISGFTTTGASVLPDVGLKPLHADVAQLYPLDRRYGCAGLYPGCASAGRRI